MRTVRRIAAGLAGAALAWIVGLALFGWLGADCARRRAEARLSASMDAKVTIGALDLGLVRGRLGIDRLRIEREERGSFRADLARLDVDVPPLGLSLVQDRVGAVRVRGVDVTISALGALDLQGARKPVAMDALELRDARVRLEATTLVPGLARLDVTIERVRAGPTVLRTPLSWVFALRELTARIDLPAGLTVRLDYRAGVLRLSGGLFGDTPLELPFEIPVLEPARELEQLAELGRRLTAELTRHVTDRALRERARDELRRRLP